MGYVGVPPQSGFITTAKQRVTSSTNNYVDLDHAISNLSDVIVWVNFVKQDSTNLSLTTSTRITLGATLVASDIVEIAYLGKAVATQTPDTGTVTNDMLAGSIANSKLATDPLNASNLASGTVPTARLGSGTASSSTFLRGDSTFAEPSGGAWNLIYSDNVSGMGSGSNAYTDSNMFSATYDFYRIYILNWEPQNDGVDMNLQFKLGGTTRTNNYRFNLRRNESNSAEIAGAYSNSGGSIRIMEGCGNGTGENMSGFFEYQNPTGDNGNWYVTNVMYSGIETNGYTIGGVGQGSCSDSTGAMTGFTIAAHSGGLGNYNLRAYGLKTS